MTFVTIPKNTRVRCVNAVQSQWGDTNMKADTTVNGVLLPPHSVRIGTLCKQDGSPRPIRGEHSEFVRAELHQRYGTHDFTSLLESGKTWVKGHDIMVECRPWMFWWRGQNDETYSCELPGPIENHLSVVVVHVDSLTEVNPQTVEVRVNDDTVRLAKREVLEVKRHAPNGPGSVGLKLEVNDAARYGWQIA